MVDRATIEARAARVERLLERLSHIEAAGREAFLADERVQLEAERGLQVSIQACIDSGAHLVAGLGLGAPEDYGDVFERLARAGGLPRELADRLKEAARQRNLLVHLYLDIDPELVWKSLEEAGVLRDFMSWAVDEAREDQT